jgi:hypothetical protein
LKPEARSFSGTAPPDSLIFFRGTVDYYDRLTDAVLH